MNISRERIITTLQYPLAPPLPFLTDGYYPGDWDLAACGTFVGRTIDASLTATLRLMATPVLATAGAARISYAGPTIASLRMLPTVPLVACFGAALGVLGAAVSLLDVLASSLGAAFVVLWLTGNLACDGIALIVMPLGRAVLGLSRGAWGNP